jgi:hypothetical protein
VRPLAPKMTICITVLLGLKHERGAGGPVCFLWPPRAGSRRLGDHDLARALASGHAVQATPLPRYQEQRSPIRAAEHTGDAAAIQRDGPTAVQLRGASLWRSWFLLGRS